MKVKGNTVFHANIIISTQDHLKIICVAILSIILQQLYLCMSECTRTQSLYFSFLFLLPFSTSLICEQITGMKFFQFYSLDAYSYLWFFILLKYVENTSRETDAPQEPSHEESSSSPTTTQPLSSLAQNWAAFSSMWWISWESYCVNVFSPVEAEKLLSWGEYRIMYAPNLNSTVSNTIKLRRIIISTTM